MDRTRSQDQAGLTSQLSLPIRRSKSNALGSTSSDIAVARALSPYKVRHNAQYCGAVAVWHCAA